MEMPFTVGEFLGVFTRYNRAVWPMQVGFYAVAALLVALGVRASPRSGRWISGMLALLWAWMGIVYHWGFFAAVNPAAYLFGGLFLLQAAGFAVCGRAGVLSFRFRADHYGITGAALIVYGLLLYPVLGAAAGHAYPGGATFGLPCPTTIVTFGLLLWADRPVPLWVLGIPFLWSLIGSTAALRLTILEDYGLLVAGLVGAIMTAFKNRSFRTGPAVAGAPSR